MGSLGKIYLFFLPLLLTLSFASSALAQQSPIVFVTQVPKPDDFSNIVSTFANHRATMDAAPRGGDLWIRYPDGTLKNLTKAAGYGENGLQGDNAIAVRDPAVHWSGSKVLFSMVVGAPAQYDYNDYRFQLYEVTGLGKGETPSIARVLNQPSEYNNVMGTYAPDDTIIFASDRPRNGLSHLHPQLDEYESTPTNTGLWRLNPSTGTLFLLDHSPSGDFHPTVDSFGRVIFTRWDHLQQDQQAEDNTFGPFNYESEKKGSGRTGNAKEIFPEPRSEARRESAGVSLHLFNRFMPWMMSIDGTGMETLNHVGRHELDEYFPQSFLRDESLTDFIDDRDRIASNRVDLDNFFTIKESPTEPGVYWGTNGSEFYTHGSGQIVTLTGAPSVNPLDMVVTEITHPATASPSDSPSSNHSGLYRNPLPLSDGDILVAHTSETRVDFNSGGREQPRSRYDFRIKRLVKKGQYYTAGANLTSGISKNISYYDPDVLVSYSGNLWELQPVELVARNRPSVSPLDPVPAVEKGVFDSEGVALSDFQEYLKELGLALLISRDVRTRDEVDRQQPFNLTLQAGKKNSISGLQFLQGDLVRGYTNFVSGRRTLARVLNSVRIPEELRESTSQGSYEIFEDGSVAAIVPARRALSWQLVDESAEPIVRERYWVTFQPGEIRVCTSCHGLNEHDQNGKGAPRNAPAALAALLSWWKSSPDTDIRNPDGIVDEPESGGATTLKLRVKRRGRKVMLRLRGTASSQVLQTAELKVQLNGEVVRQKTWGARKRVRMRLPLSYFSGELVFLLYADSSVLTQKKIRSRRS